MYSCLCAAYDGVVRTLSPAEAEVGNPACETAEEKDAFRELLARKIAATRARVRALTDAGRACDGDKELLEGLLQLQNR